MFPESSGHLDHAIRKLIGVDKKKVSSHFEQFIRQHSELNSNQRRFLSMLENHIVKYGSIKKEKLYEAPFTILDSEGIEGVFEEANIMNDVFALVEKYEPRGTIHEQ